MVSSLNSSSGNSVDATPTSGARRRNFAIFAAVVVVWLAFDQATKAYFNGFEVGQTASGPYLGLVDFTLAHNTGAAWGIFSDSTVVLAVISVVVCVVAVLYLFVFAPDSSALAAIGLSLVVAGGAGNAIDRFANLYVIDFIRPVFIDFPTFNVADIGVTCGVAIFVIALVLEAAKSPEAKER